MKKERQCSAAESWLWREKNHGHRGPSPLISLHLGDVISSEASQEKLISTVLLRDSLQHSNIVAVGPAHGSALVGPQEIPGFNPCACPGYDARLSPWKRGAVDRVLDILQLIFVAVGLWD